MNIPARHLEAHPFSAAPAAAPDTDTAPVVGLDGRVLRPVGPPAIAPSTDSGFYDDGFDDQFAPADPAEVACDDCLPLARMAQGIGLQPVATWIRAVSSALRAGTISAVHQPKGSPAEDGVIFVECNACTTRHHTTWKRKGDSTRWLIGKVGGDVYQGHSSYQPSAPFAKDCSRHYRTHNAALLAGEVE